MLVTPVKSFVVHANSQEDKIEWMLDICNAVDDWKSRKATFGSGEGSDQQFEAPGGPFIFFIIFFTGPSVGT
jgi:hypothetical protein